MASLYKWLVYTQWLDRGSVPHGDWSPYGWLGYQGNLSPCEDQSLILQLATQTTTGPEHRRQDIDRGLHSPAQKRIGLIPNVEGRSANSLLRMQWEEAQVFVVPFSVPITIL